MSRTMCFSLLLLISGIQSSAQAQTGLRTFNRFEVVSVWSSQVGVITAIDLIMDDAQRPPRKVATLTFSASPSNSGTYYPPPRDLASIPYRDAEFANILGFLKSGEINTIKYIYNSDDNQIVVAYLGRREGLSTRPGDPPEPHILLKHGDRKNDLNPQSDVHHDSKGRSESRKCPEPAATIAISQNAPNINRVYFAGEKLFNLQTMQFTQVLYDTPNAIAVVSHAENLGSDELYYYYRAEALGLMYQWAFSILPSGFDGHCIWSRREGGNQWNKLEGRIVMAELKPIESKMKSTNEK